MTSKPPRMRPATIGIDVGGTKCHATAFDPDLQPIAEVREPTRTGSGEIVIDSVLSTVAALVEEISGRDVAGIGIGIPGLVNQDDGSVRHAVNLGIGAEAVPIARALSDVYDVRCSIDNDVNVAALGAYHLLKDDHHISDLAYLSIGTGIAAGIVLNGMPHRGHRGVAGEIGHFPVQPDGPRCECGLVGCLEAVASGSAIGRQWPAGDRHDSAQALLHAAELGNRDAVVVLERVADHLASAVYLLAVSFDVDLVVIGGGVSDLGAPLLEQISAGLDRLASASAFVKTLQLGERVVMKPAQSLGAIGAAVLSCTLATP